MKKEQARESVRWEITTWEEVVKKASDQRGAFASALARVPSSDPKENIRSLIRFLEELEVVMAHPAYCPGVQQELLARADALYEEVVRGAFPGRNGNARLPGKEALRSLYKQAKTLLGSLPVLDQMVGEIKSGGHTKSTWASFSKKRRQLADLWVRSSMPLDATKKRVEATVHRCQAMLEKQGDFARPSDPTERHVQKGKRAHLSTPPSEAARELVARIFGVESSTVKKNLGRKDPDKPSLRGRRARRRRRVQR